MHKKILMSLFFLFWALPALADVDTAWVRRYDAANSLDRAWAMTVDGSGNQFENPDQRRNSVFERRGFHSRVAGLYFGFGFGYIALNSSDLKILDEVGLGKIQQGDFGGHFDVGVVFNFKYFLVTSMLSLYTSGHKWNNCFGSGIDVDLHGRVTGFELKVGPCLQYLYSQKADKEDEVIPFFVVGKTIDMWLKDDNNDGFTEGDGPIFFGVGVDYVDLLSPPSKASRLSVGLKFIYRPWHSYRAFKIGQQVPLKTEASPYSVTVTLGYMVLPF